MFSHLKNDEVYLPPSSMSVKYVAEGEEIFVIGGEAVTVRSGQFLLVDAATACVAKARSKNPAIGLCVYLPRLQTGSQAGTLPSMFDRIDSPALLQPAGLSALGALLSEQARQRSTNNGADVVVDAGLIEQVRRGIQALATDLELRIDRLEGLRPSTRTEVLVRLEQARARMHDCLTGTIGLDALAAEAGMSRFHFVRRFTRTYGRSPVAYHSDLRLRHAAHRIARGELTPAEACDLLGYSEMRAFRRAFDRAVGTPPHKAFTHGMGRAGK